MARHLLLTMGAEAFGPPATVEKGREAADVWLAQKKFLFPELFIQALSLKLAATMAIALTENANLQQAMQSEFMLSLSEAKGFNSAYRDKADRRAGGIRAARWGGAGIGRGR